MTSRVSIRYCMSSVTSLSSYFFPSRSCKCFKTLPWIIARAFSLFNSGSVGLSRRFYKESNNHTPRPSFILPSSNGKAPTLSYRKFWFIASSVFKHMAYLQVFSRIPKFWLSCHCKRGPNNYLIPSFFYMLSTWLTKITKVSWRTNQLAGCLTEYKD